MPRLVFALKLSMPTKHSAPFAGGMGLLVIYERADGDDGMLKPSQTVFKSLGAVTYLTAF